ncbi:unnamed protein product [Leptidea sinapis]|uniref:Inactive hydroxysteroid dehydrogenase-like protein 1 n=2 Tax=Leptidea sinapis TaxID=189913 RepID=A0A5E4R7K9_9NEOP|nr:unnamed protein product [Leptidea sinapis]
MPLCEMPTSKAMEMINVNVVAVTRMSRMLLPGMEARGRGAIVNVSSGSELQPHPMWAIYGASKVYVRNFTRAIRHEYAPKGIYVQHLSPLFVSTKMNNFSKKLLDGSLFVPDAETYARSAVNLLGRVQNTTGYWLHGIQYTFYKLAPEWARIKIGQLMLKDFRSEYMSNNVAKTK